MRKTNFKTIVDRNEKKQNLRKIDFKKIIDKRQKRQNLRQLLLEITSGFVVFIITLFLCFFFLEKYFFAYYNRAETTQQTAMNLPIFEKSTYRSWNHKPLSKAKHGIGTPTPLININSLGLRNDEIKIQTDQKRYLMLGDSFTFGMGVNQDSTLPAQLQKFLGNKFHNVINGGVIGQTIDDAFMYLKYEGIKLDPDFVIYNFFVGNDITEFRRHKWQINEKNEIINVSDTVLEVSEKNTLRHKNNQAPKSYFLYWLSNKFTILKQKYNLGKIDNEQLDPSLTWPVFLPIDHPKQDQNLIKYWQEFETTLKQMSDYCKTNNIKFIVAVIPMDVQVSSKYWSKYPGTPFDEEAFKAQRPQKHIKILGDKYNITVLDLLPYIQASEKENGNFYFDEDPHLNALGYRFLGAYFFRYLLDNFFH